jgi:hypothetical protein
MVRRRRPEAGEGGEGGRYWGLERERERGKRSKEREEGEEVTFGRSTSIFGQIILEICVKISGSI